MTLSGRGQPTDVGDPASARILSVRGGLPIVVHRGPEVKTCRRGRTVVFTFDLTGPAARTPASTATVKLTKWNWNVAYGSNEIPLPQCLKSRLRFEAGEQTGLLRPSHGGRRVEQRGITLYVAVLHYAGGEGPTTSVIGRASAPLFATVRSCGITTCPSFWLDASEMGEQYRTRRECPDSTFTLHRDG